MKLFITALFATLSLSLWSQEKKKIDHTAYDGWKSISAVKQSTNGALVSYQISPQVGDGALYIEALKTNATKKFPRGKNALLSHNEKFAVFLISPEYDTIRKLKLAKEKEKNFPKDSLAIYYPATDSLYIATNIKSFQLAEEGNWIAYLTHTDERQDPVIKKKCRIFKRKQKENIIRLKTSGTTLHTINPETSKEAEFDRVLDYKLSKNGLHLFYVNSNKGESDTMALHWVDMQTMQDVTLINAQLNITNLEIDEAQKQLIFLHTADTSKRKTYQLSHWQFGNEKSTIIIDSLTKGMPENFTVSEYGRPRFSENGQRVFIGINNIVKQDLKDTLLASEKAKVDVWSTYDLRLQPQQLNQKRRDLKKTYRSVFNIATKTIVRIEDELIESYTALDKGNSQYALASTAMPYKIERTWAFPWLRDYYLIDLNTGSKKLLKEGQGYDLDVAPSLNYFVWYNGADSSWYSESTTSNARTVSNLTEKFAATFASDNNGNPFIPYPEGSNGWTIIKDIEYYLVYSRFDVWALCPSNPSKSFCVSNNKGATGEATYRLQRFDWDSTYTNLDANLMHEINFDTKNESYWDIKINSNKVTLTPLISSAHKFVYFSKAEKSNQLLFRRMNFQEYPELEVSNLQFDTPKKLTTTNPQQKDYNWGTVEKVEWTSFEGRKLRGLLYKPEDFDSTKSYPMIAYFYEKYSDGIHNHYVPKPTASIVYPTEYISNGYIIFIPDIEYTPGHPAASAYDCIVSGTDYLTDTYSWIDSTRLGLQGQSWGGYQTAQLITMTTKYKAAMAGAPVSNMFSAYGGIRWGSGLSRMFQYERTQSRIGYTIWEKPELYIENSPIFGLPNVKTPLLIMHNDGDGAVPWYQGIELYMGLRRLNQPAWLLNYNGDQHNLMKQANRKDLSIRMRQFFDYYLMDAPIPSWMENGVPAVDKGINYGLELKKN